MGCAWAIRGLRTGSTRGAAQVTHGLHTGYTQVTLCGHDDGDNGHDDHDDYNHYEVTMMKMIMKMSMVPVWGRMVIIQGAPKILAKCQLLIMFFLFAAASVSNLV